MEQTDIVIHHRVKMICRFFPGGLIKYYYVDVIIGLVEQSKWVFCLYP
ncbi:hypothetical protein BREVUG8_30069 [Brevundimonas sp. G8]|nr:hypothetical protein BREVUG8_30069 [Brevundimonas sp. G8]